MLKLTGAVFASIAALLVPCVATAQEAGRPAYAAPKNAMGQPDLGGLWTNATLTELERSPTFGDRQTMTAEEAAKFERSAPPPDPGSSASQAAASEDFGNRIMKVNGELRTSFIVEPKNGRLPALAPEGARLREARRRAKPHGSDYSRGANPESMTFAERCLKDFGSSSGPPMMPLRYNNTYQIVQAPDHVMILVEMVHDVRIVKLVDPKTAPEARRPGAVRQWMGDSIGWYDGDTLVVETTNFRPDQAVFAVAENVTITETFRRIGDRQILYGFTLNDPRLFATPVRAEIALNSTKGPLFEYACHEGNYSFASMLGGQREAERQNAELIRAAEKKKR